MNIEKEAKRCLREIGELNIDNITAYLLKRGYRVLYIGTPEGDDAIQKYNLQPFAKRKAFTHSGKSKFVFLHEEYNHADKLLLLLHELGHIELGHLSAVYEPDSINMERYAEVFAYYLQHSQMRKNTVKYACFATVAAIATGTLVGVVLHKKTPR